MKKFEDKRREWIPETRVQHALSYQEDNIFSQRGITWHSEWQKDGVYVHKELVEKKQKKNADAGPRDDSVQAT